MEKAREKSKSLFLCAFLLHREFKGGKFHSRNFSKTRTFLAFHKIQIRHITNSKSHVYTENRTSECEFSIVSESIHFAFYSLFDYSQGKRRRKIFFNIDEQYSLNMHIVRDTNIQYKLNWIRIACISFVRLLIRSIQPKHLLWKISHDAHW